MACRCLYPTSGASVRGAIQTMSEGRVQCTWVRGKAFPILLRSVKVVMCVRNGCADMRLLTHSSSGRGVPPTDQTWSGSNWRPASLRHHPSHGSHEPAQPGYGDHRVSTLIVPWVEWTAARQSHS